MAEKTYDREWVEAKGHWDTDYPGASPTLPASVEAAVGKACRMRCDDGTCKLIFDGELTPEEWGTVDSIVASFKAAAANADALVHIPRVEVMSMLLEQCEPTTQLPRCMAALDHNATFIAALDNDNYPLARARAAAAVAAGDLTQDDYDLIDGILPG